MAKVGRPRKPIDQGAFEELCAIQCTELEICAVLGVGKDALIRWCKETYGCDFKTIFSEKREVGKASLRRSQFKMAKSTPSMSIWLGKQYLSQKEPERSAKVEVGVSQSVPDTIKEMGEYFEGRKSGRT